MHEVSCVLKVTAYKKGTKKVASTSSELQLVTNMLNC